MRIFENLREILEYDPDTGEMRWRVSRTGKVKAGVIAGGRMRNGYIRVRANGQFYLAHRLAWLMTYGSLPSNYIDHVNGDRADNRISNLRECSRAENMQNQAMPGSNTSGFMGVCVHAATGKWQAQIKNQGKSYYLGLHETPEAAHKAYLRAKRDMHEFQPTPRCVA